MKSCILLVLLRSGSRNLSKLYTCALLVTAFFPNRKKKSELKDEGRHSKDLTDQYMFMACKDPFLAYSIAKNGLQVKEKKDKILNALGKISFWWYIKSFLSFKLVQWYLIKIHQWCTQSAILILKLVLKLWVILFSFYLNIDILRICLSDVFQDVSACKWKHCNISIPIYFYWDNDQSCWWKSFSISPKYCISVFTNLIIMLSMSPYLRLADAWLGACQWKAKAKKYDWEVCQVSV